jgi:hypothetical protein
MYAFETTSNGMIYVVYMPTFMIIGKGIQAILRFCLRIFRNFNVGTIDGRDI